MPQYLQDGTVEDVARMVESLTEELWILKDRVMVLERLLVDRGVLGETDVDEHEPDEALGALLARDRQRVIRKVLGAPLASYGTTVRADR
jgi:hypothetical protein